MGEYRPPFTITNEILSYVSSISEKIGRINATNNLEAKPHLRKNRASENRWYGRKTAWNARFNVRMA